MLTYQSVSKLRVAELREMLEERGLYTVGLKPVLVDRLIQWDEYYEQQLQLVGSKNENELRAELARWGLSTEGTKPILVQRLVKVNNVRMDVRNSGLFSDEDIIKELSRRDDEIKRMEMIIEKKNKIIKLQNDMINTILGD